MKPPQFAIDAAIKDSLLSPCQSKRGATIWRGDEIISTGHNFKPAPFVCDGSEECKLKCGKDAVHAEQKAIIEAPRFGLIGSSMLHVKTIDGKLVESQGPSCLQCSKLILACDLCEMWLFHHVTDERPDGWKCYKPAKFHWLSGAWMPKVRKGIAL